MTALLTPPALGAFVSAMDEVVATADDPRVVKRESTYDLQSGGGREWLAVRDTTVCRPGDVSVLVPPEEDIHLVENAGDELGSSINETFELPVLERPPARPIAWRATRPALT